MSARLRSLVSAEHASNTGSLKKSVWFVQGLTISSRAFLFLRIFAFATVVPLLMRLKVSRVAAIVEPGRECEPADADLVKRIISYVETAMRNGRPLVRSTCLTRGLAHYYFLRRAGLDISLHFGIGRAGQEKEFSGHCWLTKEGEPYLEPRDPRLLYTDMYCISRENGQKATETYAIGGGGLMRS